jgi:hypothetical protein
MGGFQLSSLHLTKMLLGNTYENGQLISSDLVRELMNTVFQSAPPAARLIPSWEPAVFNEPSLTTEEMSAAELAPSPGATLTARALSPGTTPTPQAVSTPITSSQATSGPNASCGLENTGRSDICILSRGSIV